jgi:hypothetical protein
MSQLVSEPYEYNTTLTTIFLKTYGEDTRNARIRTIVVLTCGKLTGIYFMYLLYAIYFSVTMHLRQGKKVSILVPGDVDFSLVASRRGLLEAVPIVR